MRTKLKHNVTVLSVLVANVFFLLLSFSDQLTYLVVRMVLLAGLGCAWLRFSQQLSSLVLEA